MIISCWLNSSRWVKKVSGEDFSLQSSEIQGNGGASVFTMSISELPWRSPPLQPVRREQARQDLTGQFWGFWSCSKLWEASKEFSCIERWSRLLWQKGLEGPSVDAGKAVGSRSVPGPFLLLRKAATMPSLCLIYFSSKNPCLALSISLLPAHHPFSYQSPPQMPFHQGSLSEPSRLD